MRKADRTGQIFSADVTHQHKSLGIIVLDTRYTTCNERDLFVRTQVDGEWLYARLVSATGREYKRTRFYLGTVGR